MKTINISNIDKLTTRDIPVLFWYSELLACRNTLQKMPSDYLFRRILVGQVLLSTLDAMQTELIQNPIYLN